MNALHELCHAGSGIAAAVGVGLVLLINRVTTRGRDRA